MAPEYEQAIFERAFRFFDGDPIARQLGIDPKHFAVRHINPNEAGDAIEGTAFAVEGPGKQPLFGIKRDLGYNGYFAIYPIERTRLDNVAFMINPRRRILVSFSDSLVISGEVSVLCRFVEQERIVPKSGFAQVKIWDKTGEYKDIRPYLAQTESGWESVFPGVTFVGVGDVLYVVPMSKGNPGRGCLDLDNAAAKQLAKIIKEAGMAKSL